MSATMGDVSPQLPLAGRIALVTGCGNPHGIGIATAHVLAQQGAAVAITSTTARIQDRCTELTEAGHTTAAFVADLTVREDVIALTRDVLDRFGMIDILVNNAGLAQTGVPSSAGLFLDMEPEAWQRGLDLNLTTAFLITREVAPRMVERGYGRIINVSSVTGPLVAYDGSSAYGAAKAGMDGLTRSLALELGRHGITVNSVAPGWIDTDVDPVEQVVDGGRNTPIGRAGRPEEVAALIAFLAGESAGYVTGQSIVVDGGNVIQEYKGRKRG
jgi:3-oxoacyl-[acyl-carrier protein] reductase